MLTTADLELFARFRIGPELLAQAGIERVSDAEARDKYGLKGYGDFAGICFPYCDPITGRRWTCRVRRDNPDVEDGKPKRKYMAPWGDSRHLFFVPGTADLLKDASVPIILVEAEKSCLALVAWSQQCGRKLVPVGLGGCWSWRGRIGKVQTADGHRVDEVGALPDLNACRDGRITYVLLDANCSTNVQVQQARAALCRQLRTQRAAVRILDLPCGEDINGPDDLLASRGDDAMCKVIDQWEDGDKLLEDLAAYYRDYARMLEDAYTVMPVWVLHCHAIKVFSRTPYIKLSSPTAECGKTLVADLTELLVPEPLKAVSLTVAVLARGIEAFSPTLIVDEMDRLKEANSDVYKEVMGIVNSGYKRGQYRIINVPDKGQGWKPKKLSTFCPKLLVGIGDLDPTVMTRCLVLQMERLAPGEEVCDFDEWVVEPRAAKLKERCARWAAQNLPNLVYARPDSPPSLRNRKREVARPLFAIADCVGGQWAEQARAAVVRLFASRDAAPPDDIKIELLADIREAFGDKADIASADLVQALVNMDDRPWPTWGKSGKPINANQLSRLLKDFKVYPRTLRLSDGRRLKGYLREWFQDKWNRYLPTAPTSNRDTVTTRENIGQTQLFSRDGEKSVTDEKCEKPAPIADCHDVTAEMLGNGLGVTQEPLPGNGKAAIDVSDCNPFDMRLVELRLAEGKGVIPELREKFTRWCAAGKTKGAAC